MSISFLCSWFRKNIPEAGASVQPPALPNTEDYLRRMSVLPYLEDLHYGQDSTDDEDVEEIDDETVPVQESM